MQRLLGIVLPCALVLVLAGCYNSPVSVEENTLRHEGLDFSISLPEDLAQQGWLIKADRKPPTSARAYSIQFLSPDVSRVPPMQVEVRRDLATMLTNEDWVARRSLWNFQGEGLLSDLEVLEESIRTVLVDDRDGVEVIYRHVRPVDRNISLGYSAYLLHGNVSIEVSGGFVVEVEEGLTLEQAMEAYARPLENAISQYKKILGTLAFEPQ